MQRQRAAIVEGEYVSWYEDQGPGRALSYRDQVYERVAERMHNKGQTMTSTLQYSKEFKRPLMRRTPYYYFLIDEMRWT